MNKVSIKKAAADASLSLMAFVFKQLKLIELFISAKMPRLQGTKTTPLRPCALASLRLKFFSVRNRHNRCKSTGTLADEDQNESLRYIAFLIKFSTNVHNIVSTQRRKNAKAPRLTNSLFPEPLLLYVTDAFSKVSHMI
jgi:hypothetical protein